MNEESSHLQLAYSSIRIFANDGTIDMGELKSLLSMALADGKIDEDEKRVLRNIFKQVPKSDVSEEVWEKILSVRKKYGI